MEVCKICKFENCGKKLGRTNKIGYCTLHRKEFYFKQYYQEHRDVIITRSTKRNKDKVESRRIYISQWEKKKLQDPQYKLRRALRRRFGMAFKTGAKNSSAIENLGCSMDDFKKYIETKFQEGMNWSNYGKKQGCWSLDHIVPLSTFDLLSIEQAKKACHYTNFQPLWHWGKNGNMSKGDKIITEVKDGIS